MNEDNAVQLEPKVHAFLILLLEQQGALLEREQTLAALWDDPENADERLRALLKKTREILNDNARSPKYIKTVPKRGFIFLPEVSLTDEERHFTEEKPITRPRNTALQWLITVSVLLLFTLIVYYFSATEDNKHVDSPIEKLEEEFHKSIKIDLSKGVSTHILKGDSFWVAELTQDALTLKSLSDNQALLTIDLHQHQLMHLGLGQTKQNLYFISQHFDKYFLNYVSLQKDAPVDLMRVPIIENPLKVLAYDENSRRLYYLVSLDNKHHQVKQLSLSSGEISVLHDYDELDIDHLLLNVREQVLVRMDVKVANTLVELVDLKSKTIDKFALRIPVKHALYAEDALSVLLQDSTGNVYSLDLSSGKLSRWQTILGEGEVLMGECNEQCLVIRTLDGQETMVTQGLLAVGDDGLVVSKRREFHNHISEFVSAYSDLYGFVVISNAKQNSAIYKIDETGVQSLLTRDSPEKLTQLKRNRSGTMLTGLVADQIFTFDMHSAKLQVLDIPMTKVQYPIFDPMNDKRLYFTALEPVLGNAVFRFELNKNVYERIATDVLLFLPLSKNASLRVSEDGVVSIVHMDEESGATETLFQSSIDFIEQLFIGQDAIALLQADTIEVFDLRSKKTRMVQRPALLQQAPFALTLEASELRFVDKYYQEARLTQIEGLTKSY